MTQEEFDALDDSRPGDALVQTAVAPAAQLRAAIAAQSPLRLGMVGLCVLALVGFAGTRILASDPITVSDISALPATVPAPAALPELPQAPAEVAALTASPIQSVEALETTQAALPVAAPVDCAVTVEAMPLAGAIVALDISAPCDAGAPATVRHHGLDVAIALDDAGAAQVEMPALAAAASFIVRVEGRDGIGRQVEVSDLDRFNRVVLAWTGDLGLELHAFEEAADYGSDGHIGPDAPATIARALSGRGGYLATMGGAAPSEDAPVALVYTAPAETDVSVAIDVPVTAATCGATVEAQARVIERGVAADTQQVALSMPDCGSEDGYVLLGEVARFSAPVELAAK
ncbi:hypothetical protein [Jannaschia marina]|uniref:hypothetical protein n=1 Tax=Jannaschia marina TaxID=2741674 RepID=UPI0015CCBBD3|nr:hypothetical protein [Jannaschia marina]